MSLALGEIVGRFEAYREVNNGQFVARCPAHEDNNASLSIGKGEDGRTLIHCHANCQTLEVLQAVNLTFADLAPHEANGYSNGDANGKGTPKKERGEFVEAYGYRDESDKVIFEAVRYKNPKGFSQRQPKEGGGYIYSTKGIRPLVYRLPQILKADLAEPIFIAEGEKDCKNLAAEGIIATCNAMGAGKWKSGHSEFLRGRSAIVIPDNDSVGREHAQDVAKSLYGKATSVRILELPGLPDHGDVSDWLAAGGTAEQLRTLAAEAPEWKPSEKPQRPRRAANPVVVGEPAMIDVETAAGRTDTANARRFIAQHGENVRWCEPWRKWLIWDGRRWESDSRRQIETLAKQTADALWRDVTSRLPQLEARTGRELIGFAGATADWRGIGNMLAMARSEPGIAIVPEALDAHPRLFNCTNGTVDLNTGHRLPHDRGHFITKLCPHDYLTGTDGESPIWEQTIDRIFNGNAELIGFFRRLCGSAIVGEVVEHILPIFWGAGSNGKSVVVETLLEAMGPDYGDKAAPDLLMASGENQHPTMKADLHGRRLIVCVETDDGRRLAESVVKELTGGDTIKARRMREDFWSFKPSHTLILATNHRPVTRGTDHGLWRRLRLIPFTQRFWDAGKGESGPEELRADPQLRDAIRPELSGIVRWLVDACLEWQRYGLGQPAEVTAATADYRDGMDVLAEFIDECCLLGSGITAKASDVRKEYDEWCKQNGEKPVNAMRLGNYLSERGVVKRKSNGVWYSGLGLKGRF